MQKFEYKRPDWLPAPTAWDSLSMAEKAAMMKVAINNGIYDLATIRQKYNEFAEGGDTKEQQYISTMEKVAEENYDKWGFDNPDAALIHALNDNTYDYRGYYNKYPQSKANADTHWTDEFKTVWHPTFSNESVYSGRKSQFNPQGLVGGFWEDESFIPQAWQLNEHQYKKGGGIHIKDSKKGTFTAAASKHGKSVQAFASQVLAHPENYSPAMRKKANFARNASKWHGFGGNLFGEAGQLKIGKPYYSYDENSKKIDNTLNYNVTLPEIVIIPDSQKSPARRNADERYRQRTQRNYTEQKDRDYTQRQIVTAQRDWENSTQKKALDYVQAATTGIGIGADIISGLPVYSSLKGASTLSRATTPEEFVEGGLWLAPLLGTAAKGTYQAAKPVINDFIENNPAIYQYPRYAIGKFKYGFDAELPTVYRKVKTLPKIENGRLQVTNPNSRFAYDNGFGEESPVITNMTTDAPVRSHSAGNWDRGLTLAFPGKTLLGKKVVSTRPSDTFTFGNNISVPIKMVTAFSGRPKELAFMQNAGARTITSPEAEVFWESGVEDLGRKIAEARETIKKINVAKASGNRPVLLKPKTPIEDFSNYSISIENLTRETFKSPTAKDYQFMDYVFKPTYSSQTMPVVNDLTVKNMEKYPLFGEWVGNTERLRYLGDPSRWENLMYDPLTPAEAAFRSSQNIGLKPEFKK